MPISPAIEQECHRNRDGNQGSKDIFLAGGWHDDDASTKGFYMEQPFGIADRIVSVDSAMNMKMTIPQWIYKEMRTALPNMTDALPAKETVELKYPEGRWERVAIKGLLCGTPQACV